MVYTDGTHLVADSLSELNLFAEQIGLNRCYFEGIKKNHPHYDLKNWKKKDLWCGETKQTFYKKAINHGAVDRNKREILRISQEMMVIKNQLKIKL